MSTNIFQVLAQPHEEQEASKKSRRKNPVGKKEQEAPIITADEIMKPSSERPKDGPKSKGVAAEPHPMDRRSGTGRGKEMRKGGQGKRNWGTYQDDMKYYGEDDVSHSEEEFEEEEAQ